MTSVTTIQPTQHHETSIGSRFLDDVLRGLSARRKTLPSKYFYDAEGSRLFEAICELPEYYVTRTETALLVDIAPELSAFVADRAALVEFGSGASAKTRLILDALNQIDLYIPIDISEVALSHAAEAIRADYRGLEVIPLVGDFTRVLELPSAVQSRPVVGFFPGSTIGNFQPAEAERFLRRVRALLGDGALFIVGADLAKAPEVLLPAYDDADGVTAAFNRNLLVRISRELGASLDPDAFEHRAVWNEVESRIEMHLVSSRDQTARIGSRTIVFSEGEVIHTESSHKYRPESFEALVERGGWRVKAVWTSDARSFGVFLLDTEGLESVVERHITDEHRVEPTRRNLMSPSTEARNKAIVLEAFDTLFNKRDYVAAERFWSPNYVQHSAHIEPGRDGLFNLIKSMPPTFKHEHEQVVADGQFVIVHSRFSGFGQAKNWVVADFVRVVDGILVEHWDVVEDEASQAESKSGRPMFGERFPAL